MSVSSSRRVGVVTRALALALSSCATAVLAAPISDWVPFSAEVDLLLPSGSVAGRQVSIARFKSTVDSEQAISQTKESWHRDPRAVVLEGSSGLWHTVSRQNSEGTLTMQIQEKAGGGSHGLISLWSRSSSADLSATNSAGDRDWQALLPPGSSTVRTFSSKDGARLGTTVVATHEGPLDRVWPELISTIGSQGYEQSRALTLPPTLRQARAATFRRGTTELVVTLDARSDRLGIVMHVTQEQP